MYQEHPDFVAPVDPDARIWRYVDLARFLSILTTRSLYLSRADLLGDRFEGTISEATIQSYNDPRSPSSLPGFQDTMRQLRCAMRRNVAVSCWHIAEYESSSMWTAYAALGSGIAVRTTYSRLVNSLASWPTPTFIGCVNYLDYEKSVIGSANFLSPFVHKRREYESEQELRVVVSQIPSSTRDGQSVIDYSVSMPVGILAIVDLSVLVESIVLAPNTSDWQAEAIRKVVEALGYSFPISPSALDRRATLG